MTDVFISYSRKDKEFVQVLNQALANSKYDAWVDWENIPLTADWWEEIKAGIEGADMFVFVISPDSIASTVCGQEIDHAVENNKRLLPIVYREGFDMSLVRPSLGKHNWLFFRAADDFDNAFSSLVKALNTDLNHVREHTRILVKAIEWDKKHRTDDLLLRGRELDMVFQWLADNAEKEPRSTQLQRDYVNASRKAVQAQQAEELERQKRARKATTIGLAAAIAGLAITAVLGLFAFQQQQQAERGRINAEIVVKSLEAKNLQASGLQIEALKKSLAIGHQVQTFGNKITSETRYQVLAALQQAVYGMTARNRLDGHENTVLTLKISPDGQLIASGSEDGTVKLWQADGRLLRTLEDYEFVQGYNFLYSAIQFSPDEQTLATAGNDGTVRLWEINGQGYQSLEGHQANVRAVVFSPIDDDQLATASADQTAKLWRADGTLLTTLEGHSAPLTDVQFSPDGKTVITASQDGTAKLWNLDGTLRQTLNGHGNSIFRVRYSPDGNTIATASFDNTLKLWRSSDGSLISTLDDHTDIGWDFTFSPDGQVLASTGERLDKTIRLWNLDGTLITTLEGHRNLVTAIEFSPDGETLVSASGDNTLKLWKRDGDLIQTLSGHNGWILDVDFSPDNKNIVSASADSTLRIWQAQNSVALTLAEHDPTQAVRAVRFSPDGEIIATASEDSTVKLWDKNGQLLHSLEGHKDPVWTLELSPDGQTLASASFDGTVKLWNRKGELLTTLEKHRGVVYQVKFSPDGQMLASAGEDRTVNLWNIKGELIASLDGHLSSITSMAFSPNDELFMTGEFTRTRNRPVMAKLWRTDGTLVATLDGHSEFLYGVQFTPDSKTAITGGWQGKIQTWQTDGTLLKSWQAHTSGIYGLRVSPDGQLLVSAGEDNTIKLWTLDGKLQQTLRGHRDDAIKVQFSPDGNILASVGEDNTVRLWQLDGKLITTLEGHQDWAVDLDFSPDGRTIASASRDGTAKLWNFSLDTLMAQGCDWLTEYLTIHPDALIELEVCQNDQVIVAAAPALLAQGDALAKTGDFDEAVEKFQQAQRWDPSLQVVPEKRAAIALVYQAQTQAQTPDDQDAVTAILQQALDHNPALDLRPDTPELDQETQSVATYLVAIAQRDQAENLARYGDSEKAISFYQKALELVPSLDLNPETVVIETEPVQVARKFSAPQLIVEGQNQVQEGDVEAAIKSYQMAQADDPELEITAQDWDILCWFGTVKQQVEAVLFACENEVSLNPGAQSSLDSQGIIRAAKGDIKGAISDFQTYRDYIKSGFSERASKAQEWIDALQAGENPFKP
ncbi:MAG: TIR domain-containing protein [Cyanobacteria bacterium P01_C01_bin.118]